MLYIFDRKCQKPVNKTESTLMVARGWGRRGYTVAVNGYGVSFRVGWVFWNEIEVVVVQHCECANHPCMVHRTMISFMLQKAPRMSPATEPEVRQTCPHHVPMSFFFPECHVGHSGPQRQTTDASGPQPRNSSVSQASRQGQHLWGLTPVQLLPKGTFRVTFPLHDFGITCWLQNWIPA